MWFVTASLSEKTLSARDLFILLSENKKRLFNLLIYQAYHLKSQVLKTKPTGQ